jgi:hypothetical protein
MTASRNSSPGSLANAKKPASTLRRRNGIPKRKHNSDDSLPAVRKGGPAPPVRITMKWAPQFWEDQDQRTAAVKEIRRRLQRLCDDAGVTSYQQELLAQRAVFLSLQLETIEVNAERNGEFSPGTYSHLTNSLLGVLKALGLEKQAKPVGQLSNYLEAKRSA